MKLTRAGFGVVLLLLGSAPSCVRRPAPAGPAAPLVAPPEPAPAERPAGIAVSREDGTLRAEDVTWRWTLALPAGWTEAPAPSGDAGRASFTRADDGVRIEIYAGLDLPPDLFATSDPDDPAVFVSEGGYPIPEGCGGQTDAPDAVRVAARLLPGPPARWRVALSFRRGEGAMALVAWVPERSFERGWDAVRAALAGVACEPFADGAAG